MVTENENKDIPKYVDESKITQNPSTLPYAHTVGGFVIKPTKEGLIRSKAVNAMEEQTDMQLEQIRKQIELLAQQANEIQKRKDISYQIYQSKISFQPVIGKTYYLYEKVEGECILSMISPDEWGTRMPFKQFIANVKLMGDHTWNVL